MLTHELRGKEGRGEEGEREYMYMYIRVGQKIQIKPFPPFLFRGCGLENDLSSHLFLRENGKVPQGRLLTEAPDGCHLG